MIIDMVEKGNINTFLDLMIIMTLWHYVQAS